jgi:hypothetical protein
MNRAVMPKVGEWLARQVHAGLVKNNRLNDLSPTVFDIAKPPGSYYTLSPQPEGETRMARAAAPTHPRREDGEGSGVYIRRLLKDWKDDTEAILEAVHAEFPSSSAKASDISWNRGVLKNGMPARKMKADAPVKAAVLKKAAPAKKVAAAPPAPPPKRGPGRPPKQAAA